MISIAKAVKEGREAKGWTQDQLASAAGVSQQLIDKIERGKVAESRKLPLIAKALGATVEEMLARGPVAVTSAPSPTKWPFDIDIQRFNRLTPRQRAKIEGAIEAALREYEGLARKAAKPHGKARAAS